MKIRSLALPAGLAAALLASAALVAGFEHAAPPTHAGDPPSALAAAAPALASDAVHAAIADLRRQIDGLRDENDALRRRAGAAAPATERDEAQPRAGGATLPPAAAAAPARRPSAPPSSEEIAAADRAMADARESAFRGEPLDAAWSSATAAKLQQAITGGDVDTPALQSLECRSRSCRVTFAAASGVEPDAFLPMLALRLAPLFGQIAVSVPDRESDDGATVLYLSR